MSAQTQDVASIRSQLKSLVASARDSKDEKLRLDIQNMAYDVYTESRDPGEAAQMLLYSNVIYYSMLSLQRAGVLQASVAAGRAMTAEELSQSAGIDKLLLIRLMRPMVSKGVFTEVDDYTYAPNELTKILASRQWIGGAETLKEGAIKAYNLLPDYLEKTGFKNPVELPALFEYSHDGESVFPWLMARPKIMSHFNNFMEVKRANRPDWFKIFPTDKILFDGADIKPESTLLVDVGGGEGHDIHNFVKAYPDAPGKFALQDLPKVIENIKTQGKELDERISAQGISFFEPQPIKGARAYYLRTVCHNWNDNKSREILTNLANAMTPGYSKVLLNEWILPSRNVPLAASLLDLQMMATFAAMERTEDQWRTLIESAGLKITNIYRADDSDMSEGLIEVML